MIFKGGDVLLRVSRAAAAPFLLPSPRVTVVPAAFPFADRTQA